ncbi:MAG: tetratricopeptide repeat protein [Acidimicrobiales bacterium]
MTDVTDATFQSAVLDRSDEVPVVVDLWAPWCGPCTQLGPILEKVIGATDGKVELVKVDIDENPQVSQAFQVQSIPAVYALKDGAVVDSFIGAQGEDAVQAFVDGLLPSETENTIEALLAAGDEGSLEQVLALVPDDERAVVALADLWVDGGRAGEALELLTRIPESPETRRVAAKARTGEAVVDGDEVSGRLDGLLDRVKEDDDARQEFVDLLELLGPDDPRTAAYRKSLSQRLF